MGLIPVLVVLAVVAQGRVIPQPHTHRLLELRTQAAAAAAVVME